MPSPSEMQRIMDMLAADSPGQFDEKGPIKSGVVFEQHPAEKAARDYRDAVPEVSWGVLFVVAGAAFSAGHCLWPLR